MAEFCVAAAAELGFPTDFAGLCAPDEMVAVLCEGGGPCPGGAHFVDHTGARIEFHDEELT
jgi:hypothetical protein